MRFPSALSFILLNLGPVLLNIGPVQPCIQANRTVQHGQNSAKQCQNSARQCQRLHRNTELHQKDLRIMSYLLQILGPGTEAFLGADMFLALSLIVRYSVSQAS